MSVVPAEPRVGAVGGDEAGLLRVGAPVGEQVVDGGPDVLEGSEEGRFGGVREDHRAKGGRALPRHAGG
jgi:hypothetical protein